MTVRNSIDYECGDGWRNLIDTAIDQITSTDHRIQIDQVKEKFGTLRIYYHPHNDRADAILKITEQIASETCEVCGASAARNQPVFGWWKTLCVGCVKTQKKN